MLENSLQRLSPCLEVNELLQPANSALKDLDVRDAVEELPVVLVCRTPGQADSRGNLPEFAVGSLIARFHGERAEWPNLES